MQSPKFTKTSEVLEYMDDNMQSVNFRGVSQKFLPKFHLDSITTKDTMRIVITEAKGFYLGHQKREELIETLYRKGRKMFATYVYSELSLTCLTALIDDGLSDDRFPFKAEDCPGQFPKREFRNNFLETQKYFHTAYFRSSSEQVLDGGITIPIEHDEGQDALLGEGAFGQVFRIEIHKDQRSFSSGANRNGHFAMKVTQHKGTREVSFHRAMASLSHHHLLKCLASFIFSSKYHMIYEKADCNVEEFMSKNPNPRNLANFGSDDLAQQLFGLADALYVIHNQGGSDSNVGANLLSVTQSAQKTGYIHDIKPENLLMFVYNQSGKKTYWLRISDFSCAKVVDILTSVSGKNRNSWKTASKSGTPIYRAPEAITEGQTSRPYDLWSLGCVYLELLVWFLDGYNSLLQFRKKRECYVSQDSYQDEGFYYKPKKGDVFKLREAVLEKIGNVSSRCEGPLKDIARVIRQLLQINPKQRPDAKELVNKLKHIDSGLRIPMNLGSTNQDDLLTNDLLPGPTYISDSDSDSSFGGMVKVQHPTE